MINLLTGLAVFALIGMTFHGFIQIPNVDMKTAVIFTFLYGSIFIILAFPFPVEKYRIKSAIALSILILILAVFGFYAVMESCI